MKQDLNEGGSNKVMFTDKIEKAKSEMQKTNDRLKKLETQKAKMLSVTAQFTQRDLRMNQKSLMPIDAGDSGASRVAKDCTLALKVNQIRFIPPEKYDRDLLEKAYVRIMLEDDTYTTGFAKVLPHSAEDDQEESPVNDTVDSGNDPKEGKSP